MQAIPFEFVALLAAEQGAIDCFWRESARSRTGFVAEIWFADLPGEFAVAWAGAVGYPIHVRCPTDGPGRFVLSVPVTAPTGASREQISTAV